jgi:hypothetical protein
MSFSDGECCLMDFTINLLSYKGMKYKHPFSGRTVSVVVKGLLLTR